MPEKIAPTSSPASILRLSVLKPPPPFLKIGDTIILSKSSGLFFPLIPRVAGLQFKNNELDGDDSREKLHRFPRCFASTTAAHCGNIRLQPVVDHPRRHPLADRRRLRDLPAFRPVPKTQDPQQRRGDGEKHCQPAGMSPRRAFGASASNHRHEPCLFTFCPCTKKKRRSCASNLPNPPPYLGPADRSWDRTGSHLRGGDDGSRRP